MSVILSLSITRPLKKLSEFSQKYNHDKSKISLNNDILERSDELGKLANDILGMTQELENTLDEQKQLLHYVSHEIRAPLARLQTAAAIIEQDTGTTKNTQRIHDECQNIDTLIQQILNYSRSGKTENQKETMNFDDFITPILDNLSINHPERKFNIIKNTNHLTLHIYTLLFTSAIENILNNACKYTKVRSVIDITIDESNDYTVLEVRDYGPGISENDIKKVFQPFYRAGDKMHADGFGLGLSIAQKNIEKHSGSLKIMNHKNSGLIVRCAIPKK